MSSLPFQLHIHLNTEELPKQTAIPEAAFSIDIDESAHITVSTNTRECLMIVRKAVGQLPDNYPGIRVFTTEHESKLLLSYDRRQITLGLALRVIDTAIRRAAQTPGAV